MTSMSDAPAPLSAADAKAQPKKTGIDYSKFDNIEDSDDEKPSASSSSAAKADKPAEKPHCHNCHKDISKPLRCGICKKVEYCSPACQKSDWTYHKRVCKKPEEPKPKEPSKPAAPKEKSEKKVSKGEDKVIDKDDDEIVDWYRHREWKPTEGKQEFKPTQITTEAAQASTAEVAKPSHDGSAWNAAGTWEEKDVTAHAQQTLKEKLQGLPGLDAAGGNLSIEVSGNVDGEASKPVIRGKRRHLFDLSFKLKFTFKWMDSGGQQKTEGTISVSDFTNDTFMEAVMAEPVVEFSFKNSGALDAGRRRGVEESIGGGAWPPASGTLMSQVSSVMREWTAEYSTEC